MTRIFISYRRADSQYVTDSIYEHMVKHFGAENVFLDVGSIPFGVDFRTYLREQIQQYDVILAIIGPKWAQIMQERAHQANDFVRIEIENGLALNKLVIPVLVMGAEMPDFSPLPASIQDLQWRNKAEIRRQPHLPQDCEALARGILTILTPPPPTPADHANLVRQIIGGPFDWCDIPVGKVTLIPNEYDKKDSYLKANTIIEVPAFRMAKYPLTNGQFAKFMAAGGYDDPQWWGAAGWEARLKGWVWDSDSSSWKESGQPWQQPRYWDDKNFNGADQPVVGISFWEALAFSHWLTAQIPTIVGARHASPLPKITIPTEQQWQRAAQGDDGRAYPWGKTWDASRCNNAVGKGLGKTTPVQHYQGRGDSPFGVVDMAGNTWEWCSTVYETGQTDNMHNTNRRVLRGGSWWNYYSNNFRVDSRLGYHPHLRYYNWGVRFYFYY
jgi:formylglycine-generating enzyme required for sulfatase activity